MTTTHRGTATRKSAFSANLNVKQIQISDSFHDLNIKGLLRDLHESSIYAISQVTKLKSVKKQEGYSLSEPAALNCSALI